MKSLFLLFSGFCPHFFLHLQVGCAVFGAGAPRGPVTCPASRQMTDIAMAVIIFMAAILFF